MEEQTLDLKATFKAVRRHRLLVALLTVVGLGSGLVYGVGTPPTPEACALVLLPPNAVTGNPGPSPYTQAQELIVTSTKVLLAAGSAVLPPIDATNLENDVAVTAPSQDVLQIAVHARTPAQAQRLANAVATSYIAYVAKTANGAETLLTSLQGETSKLTDKVLSLQRQINATQARLAAETVTSPAGQRDSSVLGTLRTEQEQVSLQLNNVETQITNAEVTSAQATSSTQLLQSVEPVATSNSRVPLIAILGGLAGLVVGFVLAFGLTRGDRRLRSRDAIAAAIGVPVVASMWARGCRKVSDWKRLLEQSKKPSPVEAWNARRAIERLVLVGAPQQVEVRLLAFSGDRASCAAGVKIAGASAAVGISTSLEVGMHPAFANLRAACVVNQGPPPGAAMVDLKMEGARNSEFDCLAADLRLEAVDSSKPEVEPSTARTLLVVSSGFATAADLARVALAASDGGSILSGVVIVNPDTGDATVGFLPDFDEPLQALPRSLDRVLAPEMARREPK